MDIVERLKSHWGGERIADVSIDVADAIDEIKRLREALTQVVVYYEGFTLTIEEVVADARAALKGGE